MLAGAAALAAVGTAQSSYRIGENGATADNGPVRMARFSVLSGGVNWRPTESTGWSAAQVNLPMQQGAQIYATGSSRAEVQFDDGADMRLGGGAAATLTTMYSDDKGEFTEVKLNSGLATFHLVNKNSEYQIDTPTSSIKAVGPAVIRVGDTSGLELAVRSGSCSCSGASGTVSLSSGQFLEQPTDSAPYSVDPLPPEDAWDHYNDQRDQVCYRAHPNVPENIGLCSNDLEDYGSWRSDSQYGQVWTPTEPAGWQPYQQGNWCYSGAVGWTWVGHESWGWAPYHYGTWVHRGWGWGWVPGPSTQCWSPAVVNFTSYNGNVAWVPLAPTEVFYPNDALSVGVGVGSFYLGFSIGSVGCYYPSSAGYCRPYYWHNSWVNGWHGSYNVTTINNYYVNNHGLGASFGVSHFQPVNARWGGTYVSSNSFGRVAGGFHSFTGGAGRTYFARGKSYYNPKLGVDPVSGPFNVRPNQASFTPSHAYHGAAPSAAILGRSVYRSEVPKFAGQHSVGIGHVMAPKTTVIRPTTGRAGGSFGTRPGAPGTRPGGSFGRGTTPAPGRPGGSFGRTPVTHPLVPRGATPGRPGGSFGRTPVTHPSVPRGSFGHGATPTHTAVPNRPGFRGTPNRPGAGNQRHAPVAAHTHPMIPAHPGTGRPGGAVQRPTHTVRPTTTRPTTNRTRPTVNRPTTRTRPTVTHPTTRPPITRPTPTRTRPAAPRTFNRPSPRNNPRPAAPRPAAPRPTAPRRAAPRPNIQPPRRTTPPPRRPGNGGSRKRGH